MSYRYEDKFSVDLSEVDTFRALVEGGHSDFQQTYPDRKILSVYYDTDTYLLASQNINGESRRNKCRLRFYDNQVASSCFEIKSKNGSVGYKVSCPVQVDTGPLPSAARLFKYNELFCHPLAGCAVRLHPKLLVVYNRKYYVSKIDDSIRLTFDTKIQYKALTSLNTVESLFDSFTFDAPASVLEVKYPSATAIDSFRQFFSATFPCRRTRFSKYVQGLSVTYQIQKF